MFARNTKAAVKAKEIAQLEKKLYAIPCDLTKYTSQQLKNYCQKLADANCTNDIFVFNSLIGLSAGLLPAKTALEYMHSRMALTVFLANIGRPGCGKSTCLQSTVLQPLASLEKELKTKLRYDTGSKEGLLKFVDESELNHCLIASDELWNFLGNTTRRNQRDHTGDIQTLAATWSGMSIRSSLKTSTGVDVERANISIMGAIQTCLVLLFLETSERGDGFTDRFMMVSPPALLPMPEEQERAAEEIQQDANHLSPTEIGRIIYDAHHRPEAPVTTYRLAAAAKAKLDEYVRQHRIKFNQASLAGEVYSDNKMTEHVCRIAVHTHILESILEKGEIGVDDVEIPVEAINHALEYVKYCQEVMSVLYSATDEDVVQCLDGDETSGGLSKGLAYDILSFNGKVVSTTVLQRYGNSRLKHTTATELKAQFLELSNMGAGRKLNAFQFEKREPDQIADETLRAASISRTVYQYAYKQENHKTLGKIQQVNDTKSVEKSVSVKRKSGENASGSKKKSRKDTNTPENETSAVELEEEEKLRDNKTRQDEEASEFDTGLEQLEKIGSDITNEDKCVGKDDDDLTASDAELFLNGDDVDENKS